MPSTSQYRGRFAPSPTGPLHFGSLVAAVGSYLDAKHHQGKWLVRIEDIDTSRTVPGAADDILHTLEVFGLHWDEEIVYQSRRTEAYEATFQRLKDIGAVYPCACTRKEIADSALHGIEGPVYPGTCRDGIAVGKQAGAWRVRTELTPSPLMGEGWGKGESIMNPLSPSPSPTRGEGNIIFNDSLQGHITQHLENDIGDFIVKRADGLFAYQLAVVVDDATQGITDVVRGADLLYSTPRQINLQRLLGLPTPAYMHLPVAVNEKGEKLSKQTLAQPVERHDAVAMIYAALTVLLQQPPKEFQHSDLSALWNWAISNWQPDEMLGMLNTQQQI